MHLRTRHQQEAVDSVILDASGWKDTRNSSLFGGNAGLLDRGLGPRMRPGEAGGQMRFKVWLGSTIAQVRQIFEDVTDQSRIGSEGLVRSERCYVRDVLRERK